MDGSTRSLTGPLRSCGLRGAKVKKVVRHALQGGVEVARRMQAALPQDEGRAAFVARQAAVMERALAVLEGMALPTTIDIGSITIVCALGYLDFRYAAEPWQPAHPKLAAWYNAMLAHAPFAQTMPEG